MDKILVIGDIILDHYIYGDINRLSPEDSSVPILDHYSEFYLLGGAGNVASNISSLHKDSEVYLCGIIDEVLEKLINDSSIYDDYCFCHGRVIKKERYINNANGNQLLRYDNLKKHLDKDIDNFKRYASLTKRNLNIFDCVVISDYCKGIVDEEIIQLLETYEKPVFIDTKKSDLELWKNIKNCIIKINSREYQKSKNSHCIQHLIITKGIEGCLYYNGGNCKKFPTNPIEAPNVIGAGDSFLAGLVVKYLETNNIEDAIVFANKVANVAVKLDNTSVVYREDLYEDY